MKSILIALSLIVLPITTIAGKICGDWQKIRDILAEDYQEYPASRGVVKDNSLLRLYRTEDGSTWTLVSIKPDGTACIIGVGEDWQDLEPNNPGDPA